LEGHLLLALRDSLDQDLSVFRSNVLCNTSLTASSHGSKAGAKGSNKLLEGASVLIGPVQDLLEVNFSQLLVPEWNQLPLAMNLDPDFFQGALDTKHEGLCWLRVGTGLQGEEYQERGEGRMRGQRREEYQERGEGTVRQRSPHMEVIAVKTVEGIEISCQHDLNWVVKLRRRRMMPDGSGRTYTDTKRKGLIEARIEMTLASSHEAERA